MYDVVVVGGGPAGCYTASLLSKNGFDVHVLEEHPVIGEPVDCSGVVGVEAFEELGLPDSLKLREISALTLVSPSDLEVHFSPASPLANIVDRAAFDRAIADKTMASGATLHLGSPVTDLQLRDDCVEVVFEEGVSGGAKLRARMVILAGGPRYRLQRKLGMGEPADFLKTAQTETPVRGIKKTKVLMGSQAAPGSFAWIVPFPKRGEEFARVGVSSKVVAVPYLKKLLERLCCDGHLDSPDIPIRSWVIPITPLPRTYAERVLAVGDAAGQTKPTTGGGIFYGLLCAEAAAHIATGAFKKGDFSEGTMGGYEKEWRQKLGVEIKIGAFFRRLAERLTDEEIDDLFRVVQSDGILASVTSKARFDWHKDVIYFALRHPALGRIFFKGLFR
ncbi:MAG: NAD(P)/FAD-dependent oxidoreductase [Deltaproteobacteria bacterium]|nr:NAD(P)/FAD-dependent oxidoreductase [Deltaproteobacteria bacterium]